MTSAPLLPFVDRTTLALDLVDMLMEGQTVQAAQSDLPTSDDLLDAAGQPKAPFAQAYAWGGESERYNDYPTIDISFFAESYAKASALAIHCETALMRYPLIVESAGRTVVIDSVGVVTPTVEVPWLEESTTRRFQGTYSLSVRR